MREYGRDFRMRKRLDKQAKRRRMDDAIRRKFGDKDELVVTSSTTFCSNKPGVDRKILSVVFPFDVEVVGIKCQASGTMDIQFVVDRPGVGKFLKDVPLEDGLAILDVVFSLKESDIIEVYDTNDTGYPVTITVTYRGGVEYAIQGTG